MTSLLNEVESALRSYDVDISTTATQIIVKPQHYLKPKVFNEVMDKIKVYDGRYFKQDAGGPKWTIPYEPQNKTLGEIHREQEKPKSRFVGLVSRIDGVIDELQHIRQEVGSAGES